MARFTLLVSLGLLSALVVLGRADDPDQERQNLRFHDPSHVQNQEHIREHMEGMLSREELDQLKLDDEEAMEFHYFKLHDYDNNNKLDGLELAAAMTHYHEPGEDGKKGITIEDDELAHLVEQIMEDDDLNDDGYVDYYEFRKAQGRHQ